MNEGKTQAQETVGVLITKLATGIADRAENLAERLSQRLVPVMRADRPSIQETSGKLANVPREYPPLFEELRNKLQNIENALNRIESCLSRTEL